MTIQSLKKIILLEEELLANEHAEQKKTEIWLTQQKEEILQWYAGELSSIENEIKENKAKAVEEAHRTANEIIRKAKSKAHDLNNIDGGQLRNYLLKKLSFLVGKKS